MNSFTDPANQPCRFGNFTEMFQSALKQIAQPDWLGSTCPDAALLAAMSTQLEQTVLQFYLSSFGLLEALVRLHEHQVFRGFVQDTLTQLRRIRIRARGSDEFFLAHCNPARANRSAGAGRLTPPLGIDLRASPSSTCFLDEWNQKWQQRGLQLAYMTSIDGGPHYCSCNPFPFGQFHTTIATSTHRQQRWSDKADLVHVIRCSVELASLLPGWVVFFNSSKAAGASIPAHRHYQAFKIDDPQRPFPLQQAAARTAALSESWNIVALVGGKDYAVTCFRFAADPKTIVQQATELALRVALARQLVFRERRHYRGGWSCVSLLHSA